jgi:hypothetical protein
MTQGGRSAGAAGRRIAVSDPRRTEPGKTAWVAVVHPVDGSAARQTHHRARLQHAKRRRRRAPVAEAREPAATPALTRQPAGSSGS